MAEVKKSCENCHMCFAYNDGVLYDKKRPECKENNYRHWQPNYKALSSLLAQKEQELEQERAEKERLREVLKSVYDLVYEALPTDKVEWQNVQSARNAQLIIEQALSPITAEKEGGRMKEQYSQWIDSYKGDVFRKCVEVTQEMKTAFPELRIARGMVTIVEDCKDYPHQWLVDSSGNIIDPTKRQWLGIIEYKEVTSKENEPVGKCPNCGDWVYGKFYNSMFCNKSCSEQYERHLMS
jgi:hypothetical protein